jgi:predicted nucleic acid-binding protein
MIVVSDTSCISNLLTVGHAHLLADLFGEVIVPPAVENELRRFHTVLPGFLKLVVPRDLEMLSRLKLEIDSGEAEAICVASELQAERLLIDEKVGADSGIARRIGNYRSSWGFGGGQKEGNSEFR